MTAKIWRQPKYHRWKDKNDMVCTHNGILCCAVLIHSVMSNSAMPWTVARQAPLSMRILQARILEWVAMLSSRGSSQPRDQSQVSRIAGGFLTTRGEKLKLFMYIYQYVSIKEVDLLIRAFI